MISEAAAPEDEGGVNGLVIGVVADPMLVKGEDDVDRVLRHKGVDDVSDALGAPAVLGAVREGLLGGQQHDLLSRDPQKPEAVPQFFGVDGRLRGDEIAVGQTHNRNRVPQGQQADQRRHKEHGLVIWVSNHQQKRLALRRHSSHRAPSTVAHAVASAALSDRSEHACRPRPPPRLRPAYFSGISLSFSLSLSLFLSIFSSPQRNVFDKEGRREDDEIGWSSETQRRSKRREGGRDKLVGRLSGW